MAIRDILKMGDPRLLRIAQPVTAFDTPALDALIEDLQDTMRHANGAGIAAPQIGEDWQVVLFGSGQINPRYPERPVIEPTVLINPVIQVIDAREEDDWEGCLSVPGLRGKVPRAVRIRYQGRDARGGVVDRTVDGFHARVVQHECDHLIGRLYPTRMRDLTQLGFVDVMFPGLARLEDD